MTIHHMNKGKVIIFMKKNYISLILIVVMILSASSTTAFATNTITAVKTASKVMVDEVPMDFDAYTINQNNYFKLRDIAFILDETRKQFDVTWDENTKSINLISNKPYAEIGGEMATSQENKNKKNPYLHSGAKSSIIGTTYNDGGLQYGGQKSRKIQKKNTLG